MPTTDRLITPAAQAALTPTQTAALYAAADASPRKDYIRIPSAENAYCKRDRHSREHHVLTILLEGED